MFSTVCFAHHFLTTFQDCRSQYNIFSISKTPLSQKHGRIQVRAAVCKNCFWVNVINNLTFISNSADDWIHLQRTKYLVLKWLLEDILPLLQCCFWGLSSSLCPYGMLLGRQRCAWCMHLQRPQDHCRAACGTSNAERGAFKCGLEMLMLWIRTKQNMFLSYLLSFYYVLWKPELTGLCHWRRRVWVDCWGRAGITADCSSGALRSQGMTASTSQPLPLKRHFTSNCIYNKALCLF